MKAKNPIWGFYTITVEGKKQTAKRNDCQTIVSAKADRLKSHRERCPGLPKQTHKRRHEEIEDGPQEVETEVTTTPAAKRPKLQQSNINNYGCQTDHRMKTQLDQQIARLFYACNIPFNIASHPEWKKTLEMLRPGYQGPTRKDLGGPLLETVHERLVQHMKTEVQGEHVVMMQDGWSDIHNTPGLGWDETVLHLQLTY